MSQLDEADALHRFHVAREALRNFFVYKEELCWRLAHLLKRPDKRRVAIERCLFSGVGKFQSCADSCACDFAVSRPDRCFPAFVSWMDVFYGNAWQITSRVDAWADARMGQPRRKRARKRQGEAPEQQPTLQLLDRSLLRDIGRSAQAFMDAVRALPHFRPVWNAGVLRSGFCIDGALDKSERTFRKHFAAATDLLDAQPLCPQDRFDISLCLYQRVPAVTARRIIACLS